MTILHKLVVSTSVSTDCYFNSVLMSSIYLLAFYAFLRIGEIIPSSQSTTGDVLQLDQVEVDTAHFTIVSEEDIQTAHFTIVSEEDIQRMGHWKSHAFKRYIRILMLHFNSH